MSQCLNPDCFATVLDHHRFCQKCGQSVFLRERYQTLQLIGQGGFGRTYLAVDHDKPSRPYCVIKQFFPMLEGSNGAAKAETLFAQEAQRLEELGHHDQIPALLAYFTIEGRQYLVQEYVPGPTLEQELKEQGLFSQEKIRHLLLNLLPVLDFIHQAPVIHRDIKPANIIRRQSDNQLVLVDFGAAKQILPNQGSVTGTIIGTSGYTAPEQQNGRVTLASDLYSLGVTCLYLLTGVLPSELFDTENFEWAWRSKLSGNSVDDQLASILDKLVEPGTKKRYSLAKEVLQDLQPKIVVSTPKTTLQVANPQANTLTSGIGYFDFESVTVNHQGQIIKKTPGKAKFYRENLGKGVFLDMVYIAGGTFLMGSPESEPGSYAHERPQHRVRVPSFWIGKYAVTQVQWETIMRSNPSYFKGPNRPVECMSWNKCKEFCQKLSKLTGKRYRLPSEAEWEYACRAGTTTPFNCGETITIASANYADNNAYDKERKGQYRKQTAEVGSFSSNAWGLYEMHGNVWERCEDGWHNNYQGAPIDGSAWTDNHSSTAMIVLRGGSWDNNPTRCRSAFRRNSDRDYNAINIGLRLVLKWDGS
ncbi:bifunctional serine/threonine-protein kinase/formylglycine-generating enzyme family protein [Synechocystis sp. LKSZ1]|uniref:bifunctional serine/threonine-protein kinase/formylglycine-generating enzyme family protein n=1 Tax=Synechocystis sp. LKSZ1 TaxID=3144951 RepID=UPI00336BF894